MIKRRIRVAAAASERDDSQRLSEGEPQEKRLMNSGGQHMELGDDATKCRPTREEVSEFAAIQKYLSVVGQGTEQLHLGSEVGSNEGRIVRFMGWKRTYVWSRAKEDVRRIGLRWKDLSEQRWWPGQDQLGHRPVHTQLVRR